MVGRGRGRLILLWTVIGVALGLAAPANPLGLTNDGAQYLSGARNLRSGEGFSTSILYFDEHYLTGRLPAPQTVWPPGYSAVLAGLTAIGVTEDAATRAVGVLSLAAILALTCTLVLQLSGSAIAASLAALWMSGMTEWLFYVRTPNTDLPFAALALGTLAICAGIRSPAWTPWILAGIVAAAATYVRYVGIFLFAAIGAFALYHVWRGASPWRVRLRPVLGLAIGAALVGVLMLRNLYLVGSMKGGNTKDVTQSLLDLTRAAAIGFVDGLGGTSLTDFRTGGLTALLAGLGALALVVVLAAGALGIGRNRARALHPVEGLLAGFVVVYSAGVIAVSRGTMLTFGLRYLLPVIPCLVILVLAASWNGGRRVRIAAGVAALLATMAGVGAYERRWESRERQAVEPDLRLLDWARSRGPRPAPVVGIGISQATALQLGGGVLLVPSSYFTARPWTADQVHGVATQYGASHLIASTTAQQDVYPAGAAELLGDRVPAWLTLVFETSRARVFAVRRAAPEP